MNTDPVHQNERKENPEILIGGFIPMIEKDIEKFEAQLEHARISKSEYEQGRSNIIDRKRNWRRIIKEMQEDLNKKLDKKDRRHPYDMSRMKESVDEMNVSIKNFDNKIKLAGDKINHCKNILAKLRTDLARHRDGVLKVAIPSIN